MAPLAYFGLISIVVVVMVYFIFSVIRPLISRWYGLMFGCISFLVSVIYTTIQIIEKDTIRGNSTMTIIGHFLLINALTVFFLGIFLSKTFKSPKRKELERMSIKDL